MADNALALLLLQRADAMKAIKTRDAVKWSLADDLAALAETLDELKGSYAVEYVLEALLAKGNQHTLYSALELIRKTREGKK